MQMHIEVRLAWWFRFYTWGLLTMVFITGLDPNWDKVDAVIKRAIRIEGDGRQFEVVAICPIF